MEHIFHDPESQLKLTTINHLGKNLGDRERDGNVTDKLFQHRSVQSEECCK